MLSLTPADFFQKKIISGTLRESNRVDPNQNRYCVGPDLGPNALQRSPQTTGRRLQGKSSMLQVLIITINAVYNNSTDQLVHSAAFHLGLHCLQKYLFTGIQ